MAIIIDGYNLLHVTGIFGRGRGKNSLENSREALLNFLANSLDNNELRQTTVVFDASDAPRGLPRKYKQRGLTIRFASEYEDADTLIEELIRADSAPKQLLVVSSDHRIQRAASRRKAAAIDSDRWFAEIVRSGMEREAAPELDDSKPKAPLSPTEVDYWLAQFGSVEWSSAEQSADQENAADRESSSRKIRESDPHNANPFPPGYGEDLDEEWDLDS